MSDSVDREFRRAFWKLHVLHHAAEGPVYGLWMLQELAEHGHRLSPGTLYPMLARMEAKGWLRSSSPAAAKARKSYRITPKGRRVLEQLQRELDEVHRELVREPAERRSKRARTATG